MNKILKYPIISTDEFCLLLHEGATFLCVQEQSGMPQAWFQVDDSNPTKDRWFCVIGTGHPFNPHGLKYLGTYQQMGGAFVGHLFEKVW